MEAKSHAGTYDPRLDSLRAVSAIAIIPYHWGILPFGWIGVQVFFVLSGMLITDSLLRSKTRIFTLGHFLRYFFEKRALRLFPLYYAFLLAIGLIFLMTGAPKPFPRDAPFLLSYSSNILAFFPLRVSTGVCGHLWSLGVEWQFYLAWPFLVWFLSGRSLFKVALAFIFLAPALRELTFLFSSYLIQDPFSLGRICYKMPWTQVDAFAFGCLLTRPDFVNQLARLRVCIPIFAFAAVAGGLVVYFGRGLIDPGSLGYPTHLPYFYEYTWGYTLIDLSAAGVMALTIVGSPLAAFSRVRILQGLGKISYGIYVFHLPLVTGALAVLKSSSRDSPKGLAVLCCVMLTDFALAYVSYRYYESWFLRKKAQLSDKTTSAKIAVEAL